MRQWTIDAFATAPFRGNPACVVEPFDAWPADAAMQALAAENNQAETAFLLRRPTIRPASACAGSRRRWRCRSAATRRSASGHALFAELGLDAAGGHLRHPVRSADRRRVWPTATGWTFPAGPPRRIDPPPGLAEALGATPLEVWAERYLIAVLADEDGRARPCARYRCAGTHRRRDAGRARQCRRERRGAGRTPATTWSAASSRRARASPRTRRPAACIARWRRCSRTSSAGRGSPSTRPIRAGAATSSARCGASGSGSKAQAVTVAESRLRVAL